MYIPGQKLSEDIVKIFIAAFHDEKIKAEMHEVVKTEIDMQKRKNPNDAQSYNSITSHTVDFQNRMAASGYDTYGRTLISGNKNATNQNLYKKMKNKIKFGRAPQSGFGNRGKFTIV